MERVESQIAEWRAYVASAPGVNGHDLDELEDHLRHQIAELTAAGLTRRRGIPHRRETARGRRRAYPESSHARTAAAFGNSSS